MQPATPPRTMTSADSAEFAESERRLRLIRTTIGLALGALLMPGGVALDLFEYRDDLVSLSVIRAVTTLLLVAAWFVVLRFELGRHVYTMSLVMLAIPVAGIAAMIGWTNGGESSYFIGLLLLLMVGQLVGLTPREALALSTFTIAAYVAAALFANKSLFGPQALFVQGLFFLASTSAVSVATCVITYRNRLEDFLLRKELDDRLIKLRRTEQQLFQSEKLRAVGNLAAGLLHEINNPVNIAQMAVRALPRRLEQGKDVSVIVADIGENLQRIGDIVGDLRSFAYPEQEHLRTRFPIGDAVASGLRFTTRECDGIEVVNSVAAGDMVEAARTQVMQVLTNLLTNAADAVRKAGRKSPQITLRSRQRNGRLAISVIDNGVGIAADKVAHVCDVFFTTAEVGRGMGLGPSICDTIVRNHGGQLNIKSEVDCGTEVTFDLPLASPEGTQHGYATVGSTDTVRG